MVPYYFLDTKRDARGTKYQGKARRGKNTRNGPLFWTIEGQRNCLTENQKAGMPKIVDPEEEKELKSGLE